MPVYIGKSGDLVGCYRCLTDTQTSEYRATQLVSSIKHKLSHAIGTYRGHLQVSLALIVKLGHLYGMIMGLNERK